MLEYLVNQLPHFTVDFFNRLSIWVQLHNNYELIEKSLS